MFPLLSATASSIMKCNIHNSNKRYNISNTGIRTPMENTETKSNVKNETYGTSLFQSGTSLFFMGSFDFDHISNINTLKCLNFLRLAHYPSEQTNTC